MYDATKRWPSDKFKENFETHLKVHCYAAVIKWTTNQVVTNSISRNNDFNY